jgi:putative N6-adenine-specific DNA methylase
MIHLIVTSTFGLEAVVKRELQAMGFADVQVSDGRMEFAAELTDIPRLNLWLRAADRVQVKLAEYEALDFGILFDRAREIAWEEWIPEDAMITVTGKSIKSQLKSVRSCQSIIKKAIVERLKEAYQTEWLKESGAEFTVQVAMRNDKALLTLDATGPGLHKRGYRVDTGEVPIRENLAAALVMLSFWNKDRLLIDPMCGSGTILIEAAMIASNIAPGLRRKFAAEDWPCIPASVWDKAREEARQARTSEGALKIFGYDVDADVIEAARANAVSAGVGDDIAFEQKDVRDLWIDKPHGIVISNPPYGIKLGSLKELTPVYVSLHNTFKKKTGWSLYILTADTRFPDFFKRARPDRVRKLFNGTVEVNYYQYYGEKER